MKTMKYLIAFLILTNSFLVGISQSLLVHSEKEVVRLTKVEQATFKKINEYRIKQGCKAIQWSDEAYQAAYHHSYYLSNPDVDITHYEKMDVDDIDELHSPGDRIGNVLNSPGVYCVENVVTVSASDWWLHRKDLQGKEIDGQETLSQSIFNSWYKSESHRKNMLDKTVDYGAVAIVREKEGDYCRPVMLFYKR